MASDVSKKLMMLRHGKISHLSIWLDAMFQTIEFPAGIANLATSLSNVNRDTLTLNNINTSSLYSSIKILSKISGQRKKNWRVRGRQIVDGISI